MTGFINIEAHLFAVEINRTVLKTAGAEFFCEAVEGQDLIGEVAVACFDDFLRFLIGEASVASYYCSAYPAVYDFSIVIQLEYT